MTDYLSWTFEVDAELAAAWDELTLWSSRFGALLLDNLELQRGIRVLDVGCATGFPLLELSQVHGSSCRFTGIDLWKGALERARRKQRLRRIRNVELVYGDAAALPFRDRSFHLIVSNLGLNNFDRPGAAVASCHRVTRPGGRLVLTTNPVGHMEELYRSFHEVLERSFPRYVERLVEQEQHRGTRRSLTELLEGAGFRVRRVVESSFLYRFLDGSALLRHFLTQGFGWQGVVPKEDRAAVFLQLEAELNERARREGELAMTVPMLYVEAER